MSSPVILAIDSGSSSVRTVVVDLPDRILGEGREPVPWTHPQPGWAELDPVALSPKPQLIPADALIRKK